MFHSKIRNLQVARVFGVFRILFGAYLAWHFAALLPYATELFSSEGIFNDAHRSPFYGSWPNILFISQWEGAAVLMIALGVLAALLFMIGRLRRSAALYLWYLSTCLFTANPLIANPSLGYTGLLLLLCALVPLGEPFILGKKPHFTALDPAWKMPCMIPITAWVLLAAGYSFSGIIKLSSPSWIDGSALQHVLENPLARPNFLRNILLSLPEKFLQLLTWSTLALEILFVPFVLFRKVRPWAWLVMIFMHLGIMTVIDFADLSLGMLMVHIFTFNPTWLPAKHALGKQAHIVFMDGDCSFCQRSVRVLMQLDPYQTLRFAPLQGETARLLPSELLLTGDHASEAAILLESPKTPEQKIWRGSDAILRTCYLAGGLPSLLWSLHLLPAWLKNTAYSQIAKNRHKLSSQCSLPSAEQRKRFLP